jgi:hypothetical protein
MANIRKTKSKTAPLGPKANVSKPGLAEKAKSTSARKAPVHSMSSEACEAADAKSKLVK